MTLATALAELKASLDQGNEALTTKHFRLLIEAIESFTSGNMLSLGVAQPVTIAGGVIAITDNFHAVDTEASGATDDLDTINGGAEGDLLMLRAASSARTVVVKHGTGNIRMDTLTDFSLDNGADRILLSLNDAGNWCELTRSNNGS